MAVRPAQWKRENQDKTNGKRTSIQTAKEEQERREIAARLRDEDIDRVYDNAQHGWVDIDSDRGESFDRYRSGYLIRALKSMGKEDGEWYIFEKDEDDILVRVITVSAWAREFVKGIKGLRQLEEPDPTGDEQKDYNAHQLWYNKCRAIIDVARKSEKKFWWNGQRDSEPWYECNVLRITDKIIRTTPSAVPAAA